MTAGQSGNFVSILTIKPHLRQMAYNLTFQRYGGNKAWSKSGVYKHKEWMDAHPCNWECAVLTFVCPSGSPHTQWWAALRLIGHSDKKYQPTNQPTTLFLIPTFFCCCPAANSVTQNLQAFPKSVETKNHPRPDLSLSSFAHKFFLEPIVQLAWIDDLGLELQ